MTTGPPLYLVSACGSAEEFVAAFRRYADRTGLFIPSIAPLPAGRRGRLALTLKDGGVMIEGEAEILQSSAKPTVLHGRPGMTVKFVEPDEPSKTVIGELEKARLAMKPAPPSVPPRPAEIPAAPRPVVPAPSGRIDAANALAECVVIGDPATLVVTANAPRSAFAPGPSFAVPSIPASPARPKTPSTPPEPAAAKPTPSAPPVNRPTPSATPTPVAANQSGKLTSIGFPIIDKMPAKSESGRVVSNATTLGMPALDRKPETAVAKPAENPLLSTKLGTDTPSNPTSPAMPAQNSLLETQHGHGAPRAEAPPAKLFIQSSTILGTPDPDATKSLNINEETTTIGQGAPKPERISAARPLVDPVGEDEATAIGAVPVKKITDPMPTTAPKATDQHPTPAISAATRTIDMGPSTPVAPPAEASDPQPNENWRAEAKQRQATSIGFPVVRNAFETQPLGLVPPAMPGRYDASVPSEPAPPTLPKAGRATPPPARGKNPTTPPLTPRHPTPVAPVPIVRPPAKAAPSVSSEEEKTDLGTAPTAPAAPVDDAASDSGAVKAPTARSGGMRASEILAAIPAGDWTMSPDESVPHALPPEAKVGGAAEPNEPTPAPSTPPKGPPTGDWTIQLDPETGWSEPEKLAKTQESSGNPVVAVSSDKPINVVRWDDKPTGIGESKIEIDSTLMEPLKAMPALDDDEPAKIVNAKPTGDIPPPLAPMPPRPTSGFDISQQAGYMPPMRPSDMIGYPQMTAPIGAQDPAKRRQMILLAIGAGAVAVGAIVILVLTLGSNKKPSHATTGGSGSAKVIKPMQTGDAAVASPTPPQDSGSQQVAVAPAGSGKETKPPPPVAVDAGAPKVEPPVASGPCNVEIKSNPTGADIYVGDNKLGTTPATFDLPCGTEAKLSLRKKPLPNTLRAFTPIAGQANKLTVKLTRTMVSVKVTSQPPGATITSGGKSLGVTPTTVKLPSFDTATLILTKPGFAPSTQRVTPKGNNTSINVPLKKGKGR